MSEPNHNHYFHPKGVSTIQTEETEATAEATDIRRHPERGNSIIWHRRHFFCFYTRPIDDQESQKRRARREREREQRDQIQAAQKRAAPGDHHDNNDSSQPAAKKTAYLRYDDYCSDDEYDDEDHLNALEAMCERDLHFGDDTIYEEENEDEYDYDDVDNVLEEYHMRSGSLKSMIVMTAKIPMNITLQWT